MANRLSVLLHVGSLTCGGRARDIESWHREGA